MLNIGHVFIVEVSQLPSAPAILEKSKLVFTVNRHKKLHNEKNHNLYLNLMLSGFLTQEVG